MRRVSNPYRHRPFSDITFFFSPCYYPLFFCEFSLTNVRHSRRWIFKSLFTSITLQLQLLKQSITMGTFRASYPTCWTMLQLFYDMIIKWFVKQDFSNLVNTEYLCEHGPDTYTSWNKHSNVQIKDFLFGEWSEKNIPTIECKNFKIFSFKKFFLNDLSKRIVPVSSSWNSSI